MKNSLLLFLFLFPLPLLSAEKSPVDNLVPYLGYETFSAKKCKQRRPHVVCAVSNNTLSISAELDRSVYSIHDFSLRKEDAGEVIPTDSFMLVIQQRNSPQSRYKIQEFQVAFSYRDGVVLTYKNDYYDHFSEVRRNRKIPLGVRRWLVGIMSVLKPGFSFKPRE